MITHRAAPFYFGLAKLRQVKCFRITRQNLLLRPPFPTISTYSRNEKYLLVIIFVYSLLLRGIFFFLIEVNTLRPIFEEIENSKLRWYFFSLSFFRAISHQRFFAAFASRSNQTQNNVWKKKIEEHRHRTSIFLASSELITN